jgi:hypothetical protein
MVGRNSMAKRAGRGVRWLPRGLMSEARARRLHSTAASCLIQASVPRIPGICTAEMVVRAFIHHSFDICFYAMYILKTQHPETPPANSQPSARYR